MNSIPTGVRVWLATGHTDMRKGFNGLALLVQEKLRHDPHGGHLFVFRGWRGGLIWCSARIRGSQIGVRMRFCLYGQDRTHPGFS